MQLMNNIQNLSNAIILQAVKDYRVALKHLKKNPRSDEALRRKAEVERFFRSSWFGTLTSLDPESLIRDLQAE